MQRFLPARRKGNDKHKPVAKPRRVLPDLTQDNEPKAKRVRHQTAVPRVRQGRLYLAYGSNLSIDQMASRCPDATPVRRVYVPGLQLVFRGVADVVSRAGAVCPGALWRISQRDEWALDRFEGVEHGFYVKRYLTLELDNEPVEVLVYQMATHRGVMPPTDAYLATIAQGYADFRLDPAHLDLALVAAWGNKEVTPMLRERHRRRGRPKLARQLPINLAQEDAR